MTDSAQTTAVRSVGHCLACNQMVERRADGSCPRGHAPEAVTGDIRLEPDEPLPVLPGFSWGAFLIPPVWGIAHGLWVGVFFLPLWVFVDNVIRAVADKPPGWRVLAWATLVGTLAFQYEYARTANRLAWRRVASHTTLEDFARRERMWARAGAAVIAAAALWIVLYFARG